ncbi:MAG: S46 family peptidase [Rhizobiaceae bacterium]
MTIGKRAAAVVAAVAALCVPVAAEEGMWTYDAFPSGVVEASHGFGPDEAWLDHVRLSSVMLDGCSAAIVSGRGLVQTNHHCVTGCIESLSAPGQDLAMTPILAPTEADERTCPGVKAEVLVSLSDVSARVAAAGDDEGRRAETAKIEAECTATVTKGRCAVISLFAGAKHTLHSYRTYDDVRMVLGPEAAAGSFGGDPDNFNFPRFAFDVSYLRLYEDGRPAETPNHLEWRSEPLKDDELVFVSGHPGDTGRGMPVAVVEYYVDTFFPWVLVTDAELRGRLIAYADRGVEEARVAAAALFNVENNFKADWAEYMALQRGLLAELRRAEAKLREAIAADAGKAAAVGDAFERVEAAERVNRGIFYVRRYFGEYAASNSELFGYAMTIAHAAEERVRPEAERLTGYSDSELPDLGDWLGADKPVQLPKEQIVLEFWLAKMREFLTADHPLVRDVLGRESPEALARRVVTGTRLTDPAERRRLFDGGRAAVEASDDPLIVLIRKVAGPGREVDVKFRDEVEAVRMESRRKIDPVRIALAGEDSYPDANGTLRLNYGTVKGWTEPDGREVKPFTTFAGLLDRATGSEPYKLADAWEKAKGALNPDVILNVSTTNDTVGGNSGSPIIDREGRIVGAMFDGNIHSLGGYYFFDPVLNRSVILASTAIEEALPKVYGLQRIVDELKE